VDAVEPGERFSSPALPSATSAVNDELAELIDRQPDEVASILRGWLADRRA
jgi:flagellar biosynthesis/type III secretory pathway M-ring protein FliF/YscJ